jgi:hypothetical protein
MHTVHLKRGTTRTQILANKAAIEKLKAEATAPSEIIICDGDNREIGNITVPYEYEDENTSVVYDKLALLALSAVLVVVMALVTVSAQAGEVEFSVAKSVHLGTTTDFNEIHPTVRYSEGTLFIGGYLNSEGNISGVAGQRIESASGTFVEYGIVTGYTSEPILPMLRVGQTFNKVTLFLAPGAEYTAEGVNVMVVVGVEFNF